MKRLILTGCASLFLTHAAVAEPTLPDTAQTSAATNTIVIAPVDKPTTASIEQLMKITQSEKMMDAIKMQSHGIWKQIVQEMIDQKQIDPKKREEMDQFLSRLEPKFNKIMDEQMSWEKLKPAMVQVYQDSFTQKEIDDQIAFYNTPSGQSMIQKMPVVIQRSMTIMQQQYAPMMRQMEIAVEETTAEMKAEKKKAAAAKTH